MPGRQSDSGTGDSDDVAEHDGRPHGGFYTRPELDRLVERARELGITVVPEVDVPGHMEAACAAYPELGDGSVDHPRTCWGISEHVLALAPESVRFTKAVLDTVMEIFPDAPVHVGGDECPHRLWLEDPASRETMERVGATNGAQAQAWFEREVCGHVTGAGRRVIAWDEVLDGGVSQEVMITAWHDDDGLKQALAAGHEVIATPCALTYLDYSQYDAPGEPLAVGGPTTYEDTTALADMMSRAQEEAARHGWDGRVVGGQMQLWTEYVRTWPRAERAIWPRGCAIAQQLWAGRTGTAVSVEAIAEHLDRLTEMGVAWCHPPLVPGTRR